MNDDIIYRYLCGNASREEKERIVAWLKEDEKNMDMLKSYNSMFEAELWFGEKNNVKNQNSSSYFLKVLRNRWVGMVAVLIIGMCIPYFIINKSIKNSKLMTVYAPKGQRSEIFLEDGTKVYLNANSSLKYPVHFIKRNRKVYLCGEAYFEVKHDANKPFIVNSHGFNIMDLGTKFNVESYNQDYFKVSLLQGGINVIIPDKREFKIPVGSRLVMKNNKISISKIRNMDYYKWKDGLLCLKDTKLLDIFSKLELYFDVKFVIKTDIDNESYSGKFRIGDGIGHVMDVLQTYNGFRYKINDENTIITIY